MKLGDVTSETKLFCKNLRLSAELEAECCMNILWYTRPVNWLDELYAKKPDKKTQIYCVREHALNVMLPCEHLNLVSLELCVKFLQKGNEISLQISELLNA